jgi:tetratricopeptide (TPR) repeat protein
VILDPNNSLVRSYMGKAYYEEKRDKLAASQLAIAKELDPNDPTPWFYDAIRKQSVNRPVQALADLEKSAELNDRRAVYRSQLLLDDDAAARNASVSAIYSELGFEALAVIEGTEALADNFGNSSAHRLLANAYGQIPRYDISRVSESFQAQIRQPLSALPINLLDSQDRLGILRDGGPARPGVNEYNSLFARDQLRVDASLLTGSRDTWGDELTVSGLSGRFGFAGSQLHYETEGFSENNNAEKDVYAGLVQFEPTPDFSLQLDVERSEFTLGYTFYPRDPLVTEPVEIGEESDTYRFNGRWADTADSDLIWSVGYEDREREVIAPAFDFVITNLFAESLVGEMQMIQRVGGIQLITGAGYVTKDEDFPLEGGVIETVGANVYAYGQWQAPGAPLRIIAGLAYDEFSADYSYFTEDIDRSQLSPKLGLVYSASTGTTFRAAAFTSVRRPFIGSQTLEPTQVAGFNQFFTGLEQFYGDREGTISRRVAVAIDQAFASATFVGLEAAFRKLELPDLFTQSDYHWREKSGRAYVYKNLQSRSYAWEATLSAAAEYQEYNRPLQFTGSEGILELKARRFPIGASVFTPSGITLRAGTTFVDEDGVFSAGVGLDVIPADDSGWVTDVAAEYRLPGRLGLLSLQARNVFDKELNLVDTDPLNPRDAQGRIVLGSLRISF